MEIDAAAPGLARRTVRETLAKIGVPDELTADILVVTSELVSNAVEHGDGFDGMELDHDGDQFTVRVYDHSTVRPKPREVEPLTPRSRGLMLVDALAPAWGSEECEGGKFVWARFTV
jgi:anti-sigma regulatory factor (Ser/Thr protein kinase)